MPKQFDNPKKGFYFSNFYFRFYTQKGKNGSVLSFPVYGEMTSVKFQSHPYFPVIESPGVIYIQKPQDASNAGSAVLEAVFRGWPVLVLTLIMAALSGIIMWALVRST